MKKHAGGTTAGRVKLKDSWVICFVLGLIMMNYPFLRIFNRPILAFGLPLLYLYLLVGWVVSIIIVYLFSKAAGSDTDGGERR